MDPANDPHDGLFHDIFSRIACVIEFLQNNMPTRYLRGLDLDSLDVFKKELIDQELGNSKPDLIFKLNWKNRDLYLYFMLEHQSSVDPLMPLRMLEYQSGFWRSLLKEEKQKKEESKKRGIKNKREKRKKLPIILPMVLYQGGARWTTPTDFHEIIDFSQKGSKKFTPFLPKFKYLLFDLNVMEIVGSGTGAITLHLMKAVKTGTIKEKIKEIGPLFRGLLKQREGKQTLETFIRYLLQTTDNISVTEYKTMFAKSINPQTGEYVMTLAERLIEEGKIKGKAEGRVEGKAEGRVEGKAENAIEVAGRMLREGFDKLLISKITELPVEKIEKLQTQG